MNKLDRKRALKLRFRRTIRLQRRQVGELGMQAERRLEDDFFKRLERLGTVRRFLSAWIIAIILLTASVIAQTRGLSNYYQSLTPAPGGTYTEGIVGSFTNANPMYATSLVDTSISQLLFSGLLKYDDTNHLTGDLASSWEGDARGTTYTVHLRPHLTWQDEQPLTSADVVFTYQVIQNADARSPLYGSWQGIRVSAPDPLTVTFVLPNPLASFPYSLTTGIVPKHILGGTPMAQMRSVPFNTTQPVGSGPFAWRAIEVSGDSADVQEEHIALRPFSGYHLGKPKLSGFVIRTFRNEAQLIGSLKKQEVNAAAGLSQMPKTLAGDGSIRTYNLPLTAAVMTFFRTQDGVLADSNVRQALVRAADTNAIIANLAYPTLPVRGPLLHGQLGFNPAYAQAGYNLAAAKTMLDNDGWVTGTRGIRYKGKTPLSFSLYYQSTDEYTQVAHELAKQWRAVGADVVLTGKGTDDFQGVVSQAPSPVSHTYDALLYGISIGVDPDVYVYWDSSQIDLRSPSRLNFSQYGSPQADASLEAGRTRLNPTLRTIKYQPFQQAWQGDAPALGLYQPRFLYLTRGPVYGLDETSINNDAQRFSNVSNWEIREVRR